MKASAQLKIPYPAEPPGAPQPASVRPSFRVEAEDCEAVYGVNYWRALLYRALAADDVFCDGGFEVLNSVQ
jgi:hypothetical protein